MPQINDKIKLLLKFNENDSAFIDYCGNAVTVGGSVVYSASGKYAGCAAFPGNSSDYLRIADNSAFDVGTNDFMIWWWHRKYGTGLAKYNTLFGRSDTGSMLVHLYNTGICYLGISNEGYQSYSDFNKNVLEDGNWHHCYIGRSAGVVYMAVDGQMKSVTGSSNMTNYSFSGDPCVGAQNGLNVYRAYLDEFCVAVGQCLFVDNFTPSEWEIAAVGSKAFMHYYKNLMAGGVGRQC